MKRIVSNSEKKNRRVIYEQFNLCSQKATLLIFPEQQIKISLLLKFEAMSRIGS